MTKARLKKLKGLIKEAEHLQATYDDLICFPKEQVQDAVNDYKTGHPHTLPISGYGDSTYTDLRQRLYEKLSTIQEEISFMEQWLNSVDDPEMRDILRLLYINGLTQEQVAAELGYTRAAIAQKLKRFWDNIDYFEKFKVVDIEK